MDTDIQTLLDNVEEYEDNTVKFKTPEGWSRQKKKRLIDTLLTKGLLVEAEENKVNSKRYKLTEELTQNKTIASESNKTAKTEQEIRQEMEDKLYDILNRRDKAQQAKMDAMRLELLETINRQEAYIAYLQQRLDAQGIWYSKERLEQKSKQQVQLDNLDKTADDVL